MQSYTINDSTLGGPSILVEDSYIENMKITHFDDYSFILGWSSAQTSESTYVINIQRIYYNGEVRENLLSIETDHHSSSYSVLASTNLITVNYVKDHVLYTLDSDVNLSISSIPSSIEICGDISSIANTKMSEKEVAIAVLDSYGEKLSLIQRDITSNTNNKLVFNSFYDINATHINLDTLESNTILLWQDSDFCSHSNDIVVNHLSDGFNINNMFNISLDFNQQFESIVTINQTHYGFLTIADNRELVVNTYDNGLERIKTYNIPDQILDAGIIFTNTSNNNAQCPNTNQQFLLLQSSNDTQDLITLNYIPEFYND